MSQWNSKQDHLWEVLCNATCKHYGAYMVPVHHTLDLECMLMIASIVQLLVDALSQKNVENTSAFADVTHLINDGRL